MSITTNKTMHNYGKLITKRINGNLNYLDQLDETNYILIQWDKFRNYLNNRYGLTFNRYLFLIGFSNFDREDICIPNVKAGVPNKWLGSVPNIEYNYEVVNKGNIVVRSIGKGVEYLDQISGDKWVSCRGFPYHLYSNYGINVAQYHELVVSGNLFNRPSCRNCGKVLGYDRFWNLSHWWYGYCNRSCQCSDKVRKQRADPDSTYNQSMKRLFESKEFKEGMSKQTSLMNYRNWQDPNYREAMKDLHLQSINSWYGKVGNKRAAFIRQGKPEDVCKIYVGLTQDYKIKFGVTGVNLDKGRCNRKWRLQLRTIHEVNKGNRIDMANFEANIKYKLQSNEEYYDYSKLKEILNIIRELKSN